MPKAKPAKQPIVLSQDEIANIVCTHLSQEGRLPPPGGNVFRVEIKTVARARKRWLEMHIDPEPLPPKPANTPAACDCKYCKAGIGKACCNSPNRRDR